MRRLLLGLSALSALACGSDSTNPPPLSGSLSFNFVVGTSARSFAANGVPSTTWPATTSWAGADAHPTENAFSIDAVMPRSPGVVDEINIYVARNTVGSATIGESGVSEISVTLTGADVVACLITSGTIEITSVSNTRVAGTFSGAGTCEAVGETPTEFSISNGVFDVAILPEDSFPD